MAASLHRRVYKTPLRDTADTFVTFAMHSAKHNSTTTTTTFCKRFFCMLWQQKIPMPFFIHLRCPAPFPHRTLLYFWFFPLVSNIPTAISPTKSDSPSHPSLFSPVIVPEFPTGNNVKQMCHGQNMLFGLWTSVIHSFCGNPDVVH